MSTPVASSRPARPARRRPPRWVPNQHGAWAMLVVPFLLGATLRWRAGEPSWFHLPLFVCWMVGYVAFFCASGWLKAPPARRHAWVRPFAVAASVAAVAGLGAWALAGPGLVWWVPVFVPLVVPALVLASRRHERATLGGALTVAAASVMTLVARFPDPLALPGHPDAVPALVATVGAFVYFFGTVLHVKANIRERGNRGYALASLAWHSGATLAALAAAATGVAPVWWSLFFAVTTVRAAWVPARTPPLSAPQLGFLEVGLSVALVLGALFGAPSGR